MSDSLASPANRFPDPARLAPAEREALLIKCWMSHDARWFMAAAQTCGMAVTNRINQAAARETGKVEATRVARALQWPPVKTADDFLAAQAALIGFLGPDLLDYVITARDGDTFEIEVRRCFAYDNVVRAGVADQYECGIFARVEGWLDGLGAEHRIDPALGPCLMASGRACRHTIGIGSKPKSQVPNPT
jgi:hypothetical protein